MLRGQNHGGGAGVTEAGAWQGGVKEGAWAKERGLRDWG